MDTCSKRKIGRADRSPFLGHWELLVLKISAKETPEGRDIEKRLISNRFPERFCIIDRGGDFSLQTTNPYITSNYW